MNFLAEYSQYFRQLVGGFRVNHELALARHREKDLQPYLTDGRDVRYLDLGNGRLRPQYQILKKDDRKVIGIDLANRPNKAWVDWSYAIARQIFRSKLGLRHNHSASAALVCGDVQKLPFKDNSFDVASSVAAFEHFMDVPTVIAELKRVLRTRGPAWICFHPFTSITGGHNITLTEIPLQNLPRSVEPWDHLRERKIPIKVPLNEWRIDQFVEEFRKHFEIAKHYCAIREGNHLLTPEIQKTLKSFHEDELTCLAYVIVAIKRAEPDD